MKTVCYRLLSSKKYILKEVKQIAKYKVLLICSTFDFLFIDGLVDIHIFSTVTYTTLYNLYKMFWATYDMTLQHLYCVMGEFRKDVLQTYNALSLSLQIVETLP